MIKYRHLVALLVTTLIATSLTGCSWYRKVVPAPTTIVVTTTDEANPDSKDRPSPVVISIFELADRAAFETTDFFALNSDKQGVLAADLLHEWELTLRPGSTQSVEKILNEQTGFIAVMVAYRDLENAKWRDIIEVNPVKRNNIRVNVDTLSTTISLQE